MADEKTKQLAGESMTRNRGMTKERAKAMGLDPNVYGESGKPRKKQAAKTEKK